MPACQPHSPATGVAECISLANWHALCAVSHADAVLCWCSQVQDDLVDNPFNPYPGKIFNRPGGKDVAAGVKPVRGCSTPFRGGQNAAALRFASTCEGL